VTFNKKRERYQGELKGFVGWTRAGLGCDVWLGERSVKPGFFFKAGLLSFIAAPKIEARLSKQKPGACEFFSRMLHGRASRLTRRRRVGFSELGVLSIVGVQGSGSRCRNGSATRFSP
jgi:hypothetical protein